MPSSAERPAKRASSGTAKAAPPTSTGNTAPRTSTAKADLRTSTAKAASTYARLRALHPDAHCELVHRSAFELLVATVLSAQTTDVLVNKVTPHLFARYPDAAALAGAEPAEVSGLLQRLGMGMYNQKGKNIVGLARGLLLRRCRQTHRRQC